MASSNVSSSNNQTSQLPDLGLGNQQAASTSPLKKPQSTSKSALDSVTLATQNLSISSNEKAALSELSKSTLSPNAKEFVPKSHLSQPQVQHQQPSNAVAAGKQYHPQQQHQQHTNYNQKHHHHHSKSNSNGTNGVPRSRGNHWQNNEPSYPPANDDSESEDYYALTYLSEFINQVSAMPHVYDEEILNLTEILNSCIDEDEDIVLQCIVNNIIDSAIIEPNFRYSAVKLCDHLINNLATTSGITGKVEFKNELLNRCQREHSRRASLMCSSDKGDYLRGLTLFIADLSTKLTDEPILLNALPDLMQVLLSENDNRPSDNNVRTVVNAMKLCGRKLESSRPQQFKEIVDRLTEISSECDSSISYAVVALMELIARSWQPPPPPPPLLNNPYASGVVDDPLPEEYEKAFHDDYNGYENYNPAYHMPCYDFGNGDEQNSEVADAFEEFLRTSGQLN